MSSRRYDESEYYKKLGGAYDTATSAVPFISGTITSLESSEAALTPFSKSSLSGFSKTIGYLEKASSAMDYVDMIEKSLDEHSRQGEFILQLSLFISKKLAFSILGTGIETHPYFVIHKPAMKLLGDTLRASARHKTVVDNFKKALSIATNSRKNAHFKRLRRRISNLNHRYDPMWDILGTMYYAVDSDKRREAAADLKSKGISSIGKSLRELQRWRADWAGVSCDANVLAIMLGQEAALARAASRKATRTLKQMKKEKSTISRVARLAAERRAYLDQGWAMIRESATAPHQSTAWLRTPVAETKKNADRAVEVARRTAGLCDFVRTEAVLIRNEFNRQISTLNAAL